MKADERKTSLGLNDQQFLNVIKHTDKLNLVSFISHMPVPMAILDDRSVFIGVNQKFADIYESDALYLMGKKLNEFSTVVFAHFNDASTSFKHDHSLEFIENEFYSKGHFYILYFKVIRRHDFSLESIIVVCADVTRLKRRERVLLQSNKKLHDHLYIDQVTGLKNKLALEQYLEEHLKEHPREQYSFIKIDLDDFKKFNQLNSYSFGDEILTEIGEYFSDEIAHDNAQLFRLNSSSFVVVAEQSTPWKVLTIAERLRQKIYKQKIQYEEFSEDVLTVSIGIYHAHRDQDLNEMLLMQKLNVAVKHAKAKGKNSIFVLE